MIWTLENLQEAKKYLNREPCELSKKRKESIRKSIYSDGFGDSRMKSTTQLIVSTTDVFDKIYHHDHEHLSRKEFRKSIKESFYGITDLVLRRYEKDKKAYTEPLLSHWQQLNSSPSSVHDVNDRTNASLSIGTQTVTTEEVLEIMQRETQGGQKMKSREAVRQVEI